MEYAIVTHGTCIDEATIHLDESLPASFKKVKLVIESEDRHDGRNMRTLGW